MFNPSIPPPVMALPSPPSLGNTNTASTRLGGSASTHLGGGLLKTAMPPLLGSKPSLTDGDEKPKDP